MKPTHKLYLIYICFLLWILIPSQIKAQKPEFSTAGFYQLEETGREVYSMNIAWRFFKGDAGDAWKKDFNDKDWPVVSVPHGIELLPPEASGCVNYQGEVWYRKHFKVPENLDSKKLFLHFEGIMGKSKIWINGHLVKTHFGGYLPVIADISEHVNHRGENVIAVWADNSDDPSYPPGKPQNMLDFAYLGGIYRDCWLVSHNKVHITNPNHENIVAGGGLLVSYDNVSEQSATVHLQLNVKNEQDQTFRGYVEYVLTSPDGKKTTLQSDLLKLRPGKSGTTTDFINVQAPALWSPDHPNLCNLEIRIKNQNNEVLDGYRQRIGIRSIEFKGEEGLWINSKPYNKPLIGANRHQDFAVIGNALPNSLHWRDAKKLKDAGLKVIRNAHYPQDPAFMDACDELGLFVIVNTPGWQFWNEEPVFEERVYSDIRNMVRRDRNHASIFLWEPILNETWYPADFALNTKNILWEEFPYPNSTSACDAEARGSEHFDVLFSHPAIGDKNWAIEHTDPNKNYFTREWGDNVDDWSSHNSPSRVSRNWGEVPMLIQAQHYADPDYQYTSYNTLYKTSRQHIGGCLWHSFDHQRGYHPDPFYGGLMDAFRQPKYSYFMFQAQRPTEKQSGIPAETGPMVHIAHEMTPFSPSDVTVYSNCEEVRLTVFKGGKQYLWQKEPDHSGMPSPIITFENVYDFMADKALSRDRKGDEVWMLAEGIVDGEVVATHKVAPARRPEKITLRADSEEIPLIANGSDKMVIVAEVTDKNGRVKHLNNYHISFEIEGEGRLIASEQSLTNPRPVRWGSAPVIVESTHTAGQITIRASVLFEGQQKPVSADLTINTQKPGIQQIFDSGEVSLMNSPHKSEQQEMPGESQNKKDLKQKVQELQKKLNKYKLREVEDQQEAFGEKRN
jgi:beta-galactosidase